MQFGGKVVLITGGGGGIGRALASALLQDGARVVVCDRDAAKLEAAKAQVPGLHVIRCDITSDADIDRLALEIEAAFGGLDVLVNNAAVGIAYNFVADPTAIEQAEGDIRTNLLAPLKLIRRFLPLLGCSADSAIVNVSSDLAYMPSPRKPTYCATKAALHSFTISLRSQLANTRIRVIEVMPPVVDTERTRGYDASRRTLNTLAQGPKMPPDEFARKAIDAIRAGRTEVRVGRAKFTYFMSRFFPMTFRTMLARD